MATDMFNWVCSYEPQIKARMERESMKEKGIAKRVEFLENRLEARINRLDAMDDRLAKVEYKTNELTLIQNNKEEEAEARAKLCVEFGLLTVACGVGVGLTLLVQYIF